MSQQKVMLLCGGKFAFSVMRDLLFHNQLAVVVIPSRCVDVVEEIQALLKGSGSNVPVETVDKKSFADSLKNLVKKHGITMGLVATFGYRIPASVYTLPPKGFYNIHPGPLPGYRGPDPVFWQIKNREEFATVTIHKLSEEYDKGAVVMSERIRPAKNDTYGFIISRLSEVAAKLVGILLKLAAFDTVIPSRAQDESKAFYHKKQQAGDIVIDWNTMDAETIVALVNACNPWNKGAVTKINNMIIRLVETEKTNGDIQPGKPGTIIAIEGKTVTVSTINNEAIDIHFVYTDEGFINGGRLSQLGIRKGSCFQQF